MKNDTIVAIATPPGISALGIVRMTGPQSCTILKNFFSPPKGKFNPKKIKSHTVYYGNIYQEKTIVDEVIVTVFKNPRSYTGEDMVEISCHGNCIILDLVMNMCLNMGARIAQPGEFSRRAFLNGKMDLSQAEAVNSLIHARSKNTAREALRLVKGELKDKIKYIKDELIYFKSRIDAEIEWGDTDPANFFEYKNAEKKLTEIKNEIFELVKNSPDSKKILDGFRVVICGRPNAGKSSLFNLLLNQSRSIINRRPGTTRDVIESQVLEKGCLIRYFDTAGIGLETSNSIDIAATSRSKKAINRADIIVYVIDGTIGIGKKDYAIRNLIKDTPWIPVVNKVDNKLSLPEEDMDNFTNYSKARLPVEVSSLEAKNIGNLRRQIINTVKSNDSARLMITARQRRGLRETGNNLKKSLESLKSGRYLDMVSSDLGEAVESLGKIDGSTVQKDILDRIFQEFCIGK